ncbi:hypothetical protein GCM10022393_06270 [Aquimarina addita]|uniref:T9SS C-terminal target domain-containing protein n=1 Tax=Aquimarina addita TaxID=870485 RepID=A0ABP7XBX0_9FLAO
MKKTLLTRIILGCFLFVSIWVTAQETVPFTERISLDNIKGDLVMTGNSIVGVIQRNGANFNANDPNNDTLNNGDFTTAFIDVDGDPTTFSSSQARLSAPDENCSTLIYAGLYWSANYYIQRGDTSRDFTDNQIDSSTDTNTALIINNGTLAQEYTVRNSEFTSDISNIETAAVTSYLVVAQPATGCGITNDVQLAGNIAVIQEGGSCTNREKVVNAQNAGAVGVVIISQTNQLPQLTGDGEQINIPSVSIGNDDISNANVTNQNLVDALNAQTEVVLGTLSTTGGDRISDLAIIDPRKQGPADFRNIKFKSPNGSYTAVTADQVVFDGYRNTPTNPLGDLANDEVAYVCYADVTTLIDSDHPFGTYTVADMNATQGFTPGGDGTCGGWVLVAVYENSLETAKFISMNDGFSQIFRGDPPVNFTYTGFKTLPGTQPVSVKFGIAALEGDKSLTSDALSIENVSGVFTPLGNGTDVLNDVNPVNNFFNGSISLDNNTILDRIPASTNTLGFDADLFKLPNEDNVLIGNDQTEAIFRLSTDGDRFSTFLNAFSVTTLNPELSVINRVYDANSLNEITGQPVQLGNELIYELEIENTGNENLVDGSIIITNLISDNVNFIGVEDDTLPAGITYSEISPGTIQFNIPSDSVESFNDDSSGADDPIFIRFRTQLIASCEDLRDSCTNVVENVVTSSYAGSVSGISISDEAVTDEDACGNNIGQTNNMLDVPVCSSEVTLCSGDLTLVAGIGYDQYTWTGPGIVSEVVTTSNILQLNNPQSGIYMVVKEDTNPSDGTCMTFAEEFDVLGLADIQNPILDYVNGTTVVTENCTGLDIPQILLSKDQEVLLETNFDLSNLESISWQRLNTSGACVEDSTDPCFLLNDNCSNANWIEEPSGNTPQFTVVEAGEYRIEIEFNGGCILLFYFRAEEVNALTVEDFKKRSINIYPNPSNGLVAINTAVKNVRVINVTGAVVLQSKNNTFNIEELPDGVYFVETETLEGEKVFFKLIKE